MFREGFDNDKYLKLQSEKIRERIALFGERLYLEFGGKLFDDFHASRVLPGFEPDSKIRMLIELKDEAEIIIAINTADIEKNKVRGDLGITYDLDVLRLIDAFRGYGLFVGSVVMTRFSDTPAAQSFKLNANDGAINNPPFTALSYTADDYYSVKLTGLTASSTIEFSTNTDFTAATDRASGRAIVCGIKLADSQD
jgi:uncharacterized protein (UPF0371 family)